MQIIEIIFPVFAIALVGYVTAVKGFFSESDIAGLSRFVFNIAIPVLLFNALAGLDLPPSIEWGFLLSYYLVVFLLYGLSVLISRFRFTHTARQQGVYGLSATYGNLGLVGIPLISVGLGEQALLPLFTIISIHSATLFFIGAIVAEREDGGEGSGGIGKRAAVTGWKSLQSLARNPIVIGLVLGLLTNRLALPLPKMIDDTLQVLGQTALPCALFVLGASLHYSAKTIGAAADGKTGQPASRNGGHPHHLRPILRGEMTEAAVLVIFKMFLHPLLVWLLAFHIFEVDPLWGAVAVMAAGMPIGINAFMFAQKYQACLHVVGQAILFSTLLAVITESVLLAIFL